MFKREWMIETILNMHHHERNIVKSADIFNMEAFRWLGEDILECFKSYKNIWDRETHQLLH